MTDFTEITEEEIEELRAMVEARGWKFKAFAKRMQKEARKVLRDRARAFREESKVKRY
jgi:hypothetical protein